MARKIQIPEDIFKLNETRLKFMIENNDDVLLSFCKSKPPKYGVVTLYGLQWNNYQEFQKDADNICHGFWQLYIIGGKEFVIAPAHADEIYNQKINPYTSQPLS